MDVKRGWGVALGAAALLAFAGGCEDRSDRARQGPGATASRQAERSQEQAADASKQAAERHEEAADAQKDARQSQEKLSEAQQRAGQKAGEAQASDQQAQQQSQAAQAQAGQARSETAQAAAGTGSAAAGEQKTATGQVVSANDRELVLRQAGGGQDLKLEVGADTPVMMNGKQASMSDVKEGSQVRASYSEQGGAPQAIRIEVQGSRTTK